MQRATQPRDGAPAPSAPTPAAQQPRIDGDATGAAGRAPLCGVDLATGAFGMCWQLFLVTHLEEPLGGRELAQHAAQFALLACAMATAVLAPRTWLKIRRVLAPGRQVCGVRPGRLAGSPCSRDHVIIPPCLLRRVAGITMVRLGHLQVGGATTVSWFSAGLAQLSGWQPMPFALACPSCMLLHCLMQPACTVYPCVLCLI